MVIFDVLFEVLAEAFDLRGEQRDLHFRGTGIVGDAAIIRENLLGLFDSKHDFNLEKAGRGLCSDKADMPLHKPRGEMNWT
jgi:hypothetical protein